VILTQTAHEALARSLVLDVHLQGIGVEGASAFPLLVQVVSSGLSGPPWGIPCRSDVGKQCHQQIMIYPANEGFQVEIDHPMATRQ